MQSRLVIISLILLLADAVVAIVQVSGVVGQTVTLPCNYSVADGAVTSMCWGRGACPVFVCSDEIVWTDGSRVTFQKHDRYELRGDLLKGNVSLTIENAAEADSGLYCCRVEHRGWFNDMKVTLSLEIKPATDTRVPTSPSTSTSASPMPSPTQTHKPVATSHSPAQPSETQPTTLQETRTQATSSPFYSYKTDGNGTVTQSSDGLWHDNQTQASPAENMWMSTATSEGLYVGLSLSALVLLAAVVVIITKKCFYIRKKMPQLSMVSLNDSKIGALEHAAERRLPAEDNIYIIDDNPYVTD
uniref:Hepatitis A virus cellular receptor 1 n=1 Tax=Microcebus murinus TaxID=30608 RepID=A0A8B7WV35_MICMU|nr:hepatitis A virus cellular receptor 1 isoform X1 [Microcebus murinus]XP_012637050.2 hepatitis A virus cellular receptor 1 isoform X1 [Microcebus murinus]XP_020139242.1 hepatitis A virus cellular receptor 1 isoform X1 [Microcebus murinus]